MLGQNMELLNELFSTVSKSNKKSSRNDRIELKIIDDFGFPYYELFIISDKEEILMRNKNDHFDHLIIDTISEFLEIKEKLRIIATTERCILDVAKRNNGMLVVDKNGKLDEEHISEILYLTAERLYQIYADKEFPVLTFNKEFDEFLESVNGMVLDIINQAIN